VRNGLAILVQARETSGRDPIAALVVIVAARPEVARRGGPASSSKALGGEKRTA
jgi:hypothetical protein